MWKTYEMSHHSNSVWISIINNEEVQIIGKFLVKYCMGLSINLIFRIIRTEKLFM